MTAMFTLPSVRFPFSGESGFVSKKRDFVAHNAAEGSLFVLEELFMDKKKRINFNQLFFDNS